MPDGSPIEAAAERLYELVRSSSWSQCTDTLRPGWRCNAQAILDSSGLQAEINALRRIVKWACDTEDVDFFTRDNPTDFEAVGLIYQIVIDPKGPNPILAQSTLSNREAPA